jgi:hypothetical protein
MMTGTIRGSGEEGGERVNRQEKTAHASAANDQFLFLSFTRILFSLLPKSEQINSNSSSSCTSFLHHPGIDHVERTERN